MGDVKIINNIPLEFIISILFMTSFVLFSIMLESLIFVKREKKNVFVTVFYLISKPIFELTLYRKTRDKGKNCDTVGLMILGPLFLFPLLQYTLVQRIFPALEIIRHSSVVKNIFNLDYRMDLLSIRSLDFMTMMIFAYAIMSGVKAHQVYRKRISEEADLYNEIGNSNSFNKMSQFSKYKPELLIIFDNYTQFILHPINIINYIVYPSLMFICILLSSPNNMYRGYIYSLAILISIVVIVIQPLFFKKASVYGKYYFIFSMSKIVKYISSGIALALIYIYIGDGIRDLARNAPAQFKSTMNLPYVASNKEYIFICLYAIGSILVFLYLRPKIYLTEANYVKNEKNN